MNRPGQNRIELSQEMIIRYNQNPVLCKKCKKVLEYKKRENLFCSHSCSAQFNNIGVRRHSSNPRFCPVCGNKCKRSQTVACSTKYNHQKQQNEFINKWLNNEISGSRGKYQENISNRIRRYLFTKNDNKCEKCNWSKVNQKTNKVPLEINHKDGNHKNNRPENLELICPNCHSLTPNYRFLNKGNGRKYRYK